MADQPETPVYAPGIYQFEATDVVEGGLGGIDNRPLLELANRTAWLKLQVDSNWRVGDIKEVDCNNAYIAANFDGTGLGTNERLGWAICNGQNGTKDRSERTSIGYGGSFGTLGATGGSKDAVLVQHSHTTNPDVKYNGTTPTSIGIKTGTDAYISTTSTTTSSAGATGVNKNMQPYIVTLFIQKI